MGQDVFSEILFDNVCVSGIHICNTISPYSSGTMPSNVSIQMWHNAFKCPASRITILSIQYNSQNSNDKY